MTADSDVVLPVRPHYMDRWFHNIEQNLYEWNITCQLRERETGVRKASSDAAIRCHKAMLKASRNELRKLGYRLTIIHIPENGTLRARAFVYPL